MKSNFIHTSCISLLVGGLFAYSFAFADYCPTPSTSIEHVLDAKVTFDKKNKIYTYHYSLKNLSQSIVPIDRFFILLPDNPISIGSPTKHWSEYFYSKLGNEPSKVYWSTSFTTAEDNPALRPESQVGVPDEAVRPGKTLSGFSVKSKQPPSAVQYFVNGFQALPVAFGDENNSDPDLNCPNLDTESTIRDSTITGVTIGPATPSTVSVKIRLRKNDGQEHCGPIDPKKASGQINVIVLPSKTFDPKKLDLESLRFGPSKAKALSSKFLPSKSHEKDGDDDGEEWERHAQEQSGDDRNVLMLTFDLNSLGIRCILDKALFLRGKTVEGKNILGGVTTKTVGCSAKAPGRRNDKDEKRK